MKENNACSQKEENFKHEIMGPMTSGEHKFSSKIIDLLLKNLKKANCAFDGKKYALDVAAKMTNFMMNVRTNIDDDLADNISDTIANIEKMFK